MQGSMEKPFGKTLYAGWGDIDFNNHMTNAAYLSKSVDVRMMYFTESGFGADGFKRAGVGPVIMKDEIRYLKEFYLLEYFLVTLELSGLADDGSRFMFRNCFYKEDGQLAAIVDTTGGWLDLRARKLTVPSEELLDVVNGLTRTDDFAVVPSSLKGKQDDS